MRSTLQGLQLNDRILSTTEDSDAYYIIYAAYTSIKYTYNMCTSICHRIINWVDGTSLGFTTIKLTLRFANMGAKKRCSHMGFSHGGK